MFRKLWKLALYLLTAVGAFIIYKLAFLMPQITEDVYSRSIYPFFTKIIGTVTSLFNFSIGEFLVYLFLLVVIFFVIFTFFSLFKPKGEKLFHFIKRLLSFAIVLCMVYSSFIFGWALNYARMPLSDSMGLNVEEASVEELKAVCETLVEETNYWRTKVNEDSQGVYTLSRSKDSICKDVQNIYDKFAPNYMNLGVKTSVKPVATPDLLSSTQTTGIFSPFTYEPNINMQMPDLTFAAVACHEYAHLKGFAREDEASFIAWYVARQSDDPDFAYSANVYALIYATNALYSASYNDWREVMNSLDPGIRRDLDANSLYWDDFETEFAEQSNEIYDSYLIQNGVKDGRKSYGRMVDLIIAMYRKGQLT